MDFQVTPELSELNPEDTIAILQPGSFSLPFKNRELLSQSKILNC